MSACLLALWFTLGPVIGAPSEPGPPVVEVPRWSARWVVKPVYSWIEPYQFGRAVFYQGGACPTLAQCAGGAAGVLGADGKIVVKAVYERVGALEERGFQMMTAKFWGFTTWDGKIVVPANYRHLYLMGNGFFSGEPAVGDGTVVLTPEGKPILRGVSDSQAGGDQLLWVSRRERWGAYGRDGANVVPHRYEELAWLSDKVVGIRVGRRWALMDERGRQLTPLKYAAFDFASGGLMIFNQGGRCESGIAECEGGRFGVIGEDGKVLLQAAYDCIELYDFGEDDVEVRAIDHPPGTPSDPADRCRGGRWKHYRRDGKPVFPDSYAYVEPLLDRRHARAVKQGDCDSTGNCTRGKWGVLDRDGKVEIGRASCRERV